MKTQDFNRELNRIESQLQGASLILVDFTFLVHLHGKELLEWLTEFVTANSKKVLVCDEFFAAYELFQQSESEQQRNIAAGVNNFVNMLSANGSLLQDDRLRSMEQLIVRLAPKKNAALFLARASEADEILRGCKDPQLSVLACVNEDELFCGDARTYIAQNALVLTKDEQDDCVVDVPVFPAENSTVLAKGGKKYRLTKKLSSGAEGIVYLTDDPDYVCKIYHPDQLTLQKVKKMKLFEERPVHYEGLCWPERRVYTEQKLPVGFLMKKAEGKRMSIFFDGDDAIHREFPSWGRRDLAALAIRILDKIQYLHLMGILVGDIRPQNILINQNGDVFFTDLDSCQIEGYPSPVGDEDYTPAENHGKNFSGFLRTYENERFSCAVLIFYILFNGQHPYAQRNGADTIREEIANAAFRYPKEKDGDYSLIPMGCYTDIWKSTPDPVTNAFYAVFKEDRRASLFAWGQLLRTYSAWLGSLPPQDGRTSLACVPTAVPAPQKAPKAPKPQKAPEPAAKAKAEKPKKEPAQPNPDAAVRPKKKLTEKRWFKVLLILLIVLAALYLSVYVAIMIENGYFPPPGEVFKVIYNFFFFNLL